MTSFQIVILLLVCMINLSEGGYCIYSETCYKQTHKSCGVFGWARCTRQKSYTCTAIRCCRGWTGSDCDTPICSASCNNGGTCISPDTCRCPSSHSGAQCQTSLCSYKLPCFPGQCSYPHTCECSEGFSDPSSGCLTFSVLNSLPQIAECETTLARFRRSDQKELLYYKTPCSGSASNDTFWSKQQLFNYANFSMRSLYPALADNVTAPNYISSFSFGIVYSAVRVVHTKHPRPGDSRRFVAFSNLFRCPVVSDDNPEENIATCKIIEDNYNINIEHNDILTVTYLTKSGGFRQLYDKDHNRAYTRQHYKGQSIEKTVEFRFDFMSPVHCSEPGSKTTCSAAEKPIYVGKDITQNEIDITWSGWFDALSGIAYYYLEVFHLKPNIHGDLTEPEPLTPMLYFKTFNTTSVEFPHFTPPHSGMYSILLQASDKANNSKIARRLVLYDNESTLSLTKPGMLLGNAINASDMYIGDGGIHVSTAVPETGFLWQTTKNGKKTHIVLDWKNHFVNKMYEEGKLLNKVLPYPTQFVNLEDDGILRSKKYVSMDDNEGMRTVNAIPNIHGIVKFETKKVYTDDRRVPVSGWEAHSLSERYEVNEMLHDGSFVRFWVRATDIMNHTLADYTEVHIDNTPPRLAGVKFHENLVNGTHNHTSRITFVASDDGSGVHWIEYSFFVSNSTIELEKGAMPANRNNATRACIQDPMCNCVLETCFLREQTLDFDNCRFLVPKEDLNKSARIEVNVYNQALLYDTFTVNIRRLTDLGGLEEYSGPTNIHIEKNLATGVRLVWDLPKKASCYGRADIDVVVVDSGGRVKVIHVHNEGTFIDLVGLEPDNDYSISLKLGYRGTELAAQPYKFKTAPKQNYLEGSVIAGIVASAVAVIGIIISIVVVSYRRRRMQPEKGGLKALSFKYRDAVDAINIGEKKNNSEM